MGVARWPLIFAPTGLDPEVHLCEVLSRIADIATRLTALSSPAAWTSRSSQTTPQVVCVFRGRSRIALYLLRLHKWRQQSSGLCKQHVRDSFSRMTVPQGRDGSLLGFAREN